MSEPSAAPRPDDLPVVEIRVHGVSGTAPESLLDTPHVVQVAGDRHGRIFRPADEFGRPLLGVPLDGPRGSATRLLEGYHWGRMTSGGWSKAIWALLFPFALNNVAHWMLPPPWLTRGAGRSCLLLCRALLRLAGALLTALLTAQLTVLVMDLIVTQCATGGSSAGPMGTGSSDGRCLASIPHLDWFWAHPLVRSLLGGAVLVIVLTVIDRISKAAWKTSIPTTAPAHESLQAGAAGADFYAGDPDVPTLRALHAIISGAVATVLVLGGPASAAHGFDRVVWVVAAILTVGAILACTLLGDPISDFASQAHRWVQVAAVVPGRTIALLGWLLAVSFGPTASGAAGGYRAPGVPAPLRGSDDSVGFLVIALVIVTALLAILLIAPARQSRVRQLARGAEHTPRPYLPWAGGWFSAPIAATAGLVGAGLGVGLSFTTSGCLHGSCRPQLVRTDPGNEHLLLPSFYSSITVMWGLSMVVLLAALLVWAVIVIGRVQAARWRPLALFRPAFVLQSPSGAAGSLPTRRRVRIAFAWQLARLKLSGGRVLTTLAVTMAAAGLLSMQAQWLGRGSTQVLPSWIGHLLNHTGLSAPARWLQLTSPRVYADLGVVGVLALNLLALGLLYAVYTAARRPNTARQLGILWDLASYWPRVTHPFIPPCYAQKVVPELADRVRRYAESGYRVVLCGHSQGSLLVTASLLRLFATAPDCADRVGLVTAGSQLQWAYARGFPSVIDVPAYRELLKMIAPRWRSLVRGTDPLGGAVLTWNLAPTPGLDGPDLGAVVLTPANDDSAGLADYDHGQVSLDGARVIGPEHWLPDPPLIPDLSPIGETTTAIWLGLHRHSDYWRDPEWNRAVALAAGLDAPAPGPAAVSERFAGPDRGFSPKLERRPASEQAAL